MSGKDSFITGEAQAFLQLLKGSLREPTSSGPTLLPQVLEFLPPKQQLSPLPEMSWPLLGEGVEDPISELETAFPRSGQNILQGLHFHFPQTPSRGQWSGSSKEAVHSWLAQNKRPPDPGVRASTSGSDQPPLRASSCSQEIWGS